MPTYKNIGDKEIIVPTRGYIFPENEEVEVPEFLPPNDDLALISTDPYPKSEIILSRVINGNTEIEVPFISSSYTVVIVGQGGVLGVSTGDPTKFYGVSANSDFVRTFSWYSAPKLKLENKVGTFTGVITISV
jgi:hypothetical protein